MRRYPLPNYRLRSRGYRVVVAHLYAQEIMRRSPGDHCRVMRGNFYRYVSPEQ